MKKTAEISVLMSVYYKEKPEYLKSAVESVATQTLMPKEIVLVADGPLTEELNQVIDELKRKYDILKLVPLKENVQLGRALAEGVSNCECDLIARMDTDDIAVSNRFELQYEYMLAHPEVSVLGGYIEEFDDEDDTYCKVKKMPISEEDLKNYAKYRNPINHMTVMFRKTAVCEVGNYRHFPFLEDYELWIRLLSKGYTFANLPQVLVRARTNLNMYGRRGGNSYCKRYMKLRQMQKDYGLLTWSEYQVARIMTAVMTLQPSVLRKLVYRRALRK